jgi:hypothetical protein
VLSAGGLVCGVQETHTQKRHSSNSTQTTVGVLPAGHCDRMHWQSLLGRGHAVLDQRSRRLSWLGCCAT